MIVGNGLLARAFERYRDNNNVIIFASGVSNSSEHLIDKFEREARLLERYIDLPNKKLIYFSTCSISDNSIRSPYVLHKLNMEDLIRSSHQNHIIFRLPIVVGETPNRNTFFNNIKNKILNKEPITVFSNASRYLIDIQDLAITLPCFIDDRDTANISINTCYDNRMLVIDIINMMQEILAETTDITLVDSIHNHDVDNKEFISRLRNNNLLPDGDYNKALLEKYLKNTRLDMELHAKECMVS